MRDGNCCANAWFLVVEDQRFGEVTIVGASDAPIPWPIGKRKGQRGRLSLILFADLVRAVQRESNQAVAHWFGVSGQTVTQWRKALEVSPNNKGTFQIRSAYSQEDWAVEARKKAVKKARDPQRRERIATSKRGKKRPPEVAKKMRTAFAGRKHSEQTRQQMSEAQKKRGTRPPWLNKPWEPWEDALFEKPLTQKEIAEKTGRTIPAIQGRRKTLGLPDARTKAVRRMTGRSR